MAGEVPDNIFENLHEVLNIGVKTYFHTSASSRLVLEES